MRLISHCQNQVQPTIDMLVTAKSAPLPLPTFRDINVQPPTPQAMQKIAQQQQQNTHTHTKRGAAFPWARVGADGLTFEFIQHDYEVPPSPHRHMVMESRTAMTRLVVRVTHSSHCNDPPPMG